MVTEPIWSARCPSATSSAWSCPCRCGHDRHDLVGLPRHWGRGELRFVRKPREGSISPAMMSSLSDQDKLRVTFGSFLTCPWCPQRICPWCSTVTLWAMSSEFHVVLDHQHRTVLDDGLKAPQSWRVRSSCGDGFVEHQEIGSGSAACRSLALLLAVAEQSGSLFSVLQKDHLGDSSTRSRTASRLKVNAPNTLRRGKEISRFSTPWIIIDRRCLELRPTPACTIWFSFISWGPVHGNESPPTSLWSCRRSGRARWSCRPRWGRHDADFVFLDLKREIVDGLGHQRAAPRLDCEQEFLGLVTYQHDRLLFRRCAVGAELSVSP